VRPLRLAATLIAAALVASPLSAQSAAAPCPPAPAEAVSPEVAARRAVHASLRAVARDAAVRAATAEGVVPEGLMLLRGGAGGPVEVALHRSNLPPAAGDAARAALAAALSTRWPDSLPFRGLVRLDAGAEEGRLLPPTANVCPVVQNDRASISRRMLRWAHLNSGAAPAGGRFSARVRVLLSREGEVLFPELLQGSGWSAFDEAVLVAATALKLSPATEDGAPIDAWVVLPVTLVMEDA
jgi:TonB family protein